jgi:hypothetical protein
MTTTMTWLGAALVALLLAGCGTPTGVKTTAALTAKLSTQMNGQLTDYINGQNAVRDADAKRLTAMHAQTDFLARADKDEIAILSLVNSKASSALSAIDAATADPPGIGDGSLYLKALQTKYGKNSFNGAPLSDIANIAGAIAAPPTAEAQAKALAAFGQEVYRDLKKSNDSAKPAGQ